MPWSGLVGEKNKIYSNPCHAPLPKELAVAVAPNGNSYKSNNYCKVSMQQQRFCCQYVFFTKHKKITSETPLPCRILLLSQILLENVRGRYPGLACWCGCARLRNKVQ